MTYVDWTVVRIIMNTKSKMVLSAVLSTSIVLIQFAQLNHVLILKMIGKGFVLFKINSSPTAFYIIKPICIIVIGFKVSNYF